MKLQFFPNIKLTIEPIPESTWGISLANLLPREIWDCLRHEVYDNFNYTCAICGTRERQLQCHEKWSYNDRLKIQKLVGFQCLCLDCHYIKHWGRTVATAHKEDDKEIIPYLTKHFCRVNKCTPSAFSLYKVEIGSISQGRSKHEYKVDFGKFNPSNVELVWIKRSETKRSAKK